MKLSKQWMLAPPRRRLCPKTPWAARAWRLKRGIVNAPGHYKRLEKAEAQRAKYEAAMAETRRRRADHPG